MNKQEASTKINTDNKYNPFLYTLSGAFIFDFLPCPIDVADPEFIYVNLSSMPRRESIGLISQWNTAWEAGQFRTDICAEDLPDNLRWLEEVEDRNIYLLPHTDKNRYAAYSALFHLLPQKTLNRFGLPQIEKGIWPATPFISEREVKLPIDFNDKLAHAFAYHIWPYLNQQSNLGSFSDNDPLKLLAHNLNFWLPHIYKVIENRMSGFDRTKYKSDEVKKRIDEIQAKQPLGIVNINPPLMGGAIWYGEEDAAEATKELMEMADSQGKLRSIIDVVKSHRVEDDFSDRWSYAKEDFERKLYKKRSKYKISFVELDDTIPVHSNDSEISENLLWENFLSILDPKQKQIVVCLRNGETRLADIANKMGYSNHSPISKSLKKIRKKAEKFLN